MESLKPLLICALVVATACGGDANPAPGGEGYAKAGDPLPGLPDADLERFHRGRDLFFHEFTASEGLGPIFNQKRCSSCHDLPTLGGYGAEIVTKATHWDGTRCNLLADEGGDVIQARVTDEMIAHGGAGERFPGSATERAEIVPPSLYGLGLVDLIPDDEIVLRADPEDGDGDGISGRLGRDSAGRIGRFGRRSEFATLRDFIETALELEMSLTTSRYPLDVMPNNTPLPAGADVAADPEVGDSAVDLLHDFVRFLAVPARDNGTGATADTVRRGERLFTEAGCAECHTPVMTTGESEVPSLAHRGVALWSDLLVHDLGPEVASICGPDASPTEFRTSPLMGLGLRGPLIHDGRARNIETAVRMHGGEAERARKAFERMDPAGRAALLRFLRSL
jgi:CxxC motif-containing protein (DUF1111 family)